MVKALFVIAAAYQPSVIFIDEVDSLLTARSENEHESSRRLKTEFLVQLDGARTTGEERILIIGATNRPWELDEAARRRFVKRLYIPLPGIEGRRQIVHIAIGGMNDQTTQYDISDKDIEEVVRKTKGYSGADVMNMIREAALCPLREVVDISTINTRDLRSINIEDFRKAIKVVKSSVSSTDIFEYRKWGKSFGTFELVEEEEDS